ncbi:MAG: PspC domain-containing protein [Chloroflexi bacterium]|nr:MAG: PspC domain-containing protein [Chloroflexota bacterium]
MGTRLYRSRDDRVLAGVAGGLAELWGADPSVVRIVWALLVILTGGIALVVYIVMAIVVPEEGDEEVSPPPAAGTIATGPAVADWRSQRAAERDSRREARRARRTARDGDGRSASIVVGALLVIAGAFFLVREYLPSIDFDWVWPAALVALGILILVTAARPGGISGPKNSS